MSLSSSTIAAIQKLGAAAFAANEQLKKEVKTYAARVHGAISNNPYNPNNDLLIENWKAVARLSQTLTGIEAELERGYQIAAKIQEDSQLEAQAGAAVVKAKTTSSVTRLAPRQTLATRVDLTPTDVQVKPKKKTAKIKGEAAPALNGNAVKLVAHFDRTLVPNEYSMVKQTGAAQETGIPLGSMTSAMKKLIAAGFIVTRQDGAIKRTTLLLV